MPIGSLSNVGNSWKHVAVKGESEGMRPFSDSSSDLDVDGLIEEAARKIDFSYLDQRQERKERSRLVSETVARLPEELFSGVFRDENGRYDIAYRPATGSDTRYTAGNLGVIRIGSFAFDTSESDKHVELVLLHELHHSRNRQLLGTKQEVNPTEEELIVRIADVSRALDIFDGSRPPDDWRLKERILGELDALSTKVSPGRFEELSREATRAIIRLGDSDMRPV